jgi:hypothetical protein
LAAKLSHQSRLIDRWRCNDWRSRRSRSHHWCRTHSRGRCRHRNWCRTNCSSWCCSRRKCGCRHRSWRCSRSYYRAAELPCECFVISCHQRIPAALLKASAAC